MFTISFVAFLFASGVGTTGGAVRYAIISRLPGISAVLAAHPCFSLSAQEKRNAADATKNTARRIMEFVALYIILYFFCRLVKYENNNFWAKIGVWEGL